MSRYLNNAAVQMYDSRVKDAFQGKGMLKDTVDMRSGVIGSAYQFLYRGIVEAQQRGAPGSSVPLVNPSYSRPTATLNNWDTSIFTDIFQQKEVNFDEIASISNVNALTLGRRIDKIIINSANAASLDSDNQIAAGGTNLTVDKLRQVLSQFDALGVPYNECTIAISASGFKSLLKDQQVTSILYNGIKPLSTGNMSEYLGMKIIILPNNTGLPPDGSGFTTSLPVSANIVTAYAYHRLAIGYAEADIESRVDYVPEKASYLTLAALRAGAIAVDPAGIISIAYDQTA